MLTLPIKGVWYRMVLSGVKKEEYRKISPYYASRFGKLFPDADTHADVLFRNGYSAHSPSFAADCTCRKGTGRPEWGAEPGTEYYVLTVHGVVPADGPQREILPACTEERQCQKTQKTQKT